MERRIYRNKRSLMAKLGRRFESSPIPYAGRLKPSFNINDEERKYTSFIDQIPQDEEIVLFTRPKLIE